MALSSIEYCSVFPVLLYIPVNIYNIEFILNLILWKWIHSHRVVHLGWSFQCQSISVQFFSSSVSCLYFLMEFAIFLMFHLNACAGGSLKLQIRTHTIKANANRNLSEKSLWDASKVTFCFGVICYSRNCDTVFIHFYCHHHHCWYYYYHYLCSIHAWHGAQSRDEYYVYNMYICIYSTIYTAIPKISTLISIIALVNIA